MDVNHDATAGRGAIQAFLRDNVYVARSHWLGSGHAKNRIFDDRKRG